MTITASESPGRSAPKRRRGGQPGNANRLRHGRWSKQYSAREAYIRGLVRKAENFIIRLGMIARSRANLRRVAAIGRRQALPPVLGQGKGSNRRAGTEEHAGNGAAKACPRQTEADQFCEILLRDRNFGG